MLMLQEVTMTDSNFLFQSGKEQFNSNPGNIQQRTNLK